MSCKGKLGNKVSIEDLFKDTYGLDGHKKIHHDIIIANTINTCDCSKRAVHELLYGKTYDNVLSKEKNDYRLSS